MHYAGAETEVSGGGWSGTGLLLLKQERKELSCDDGLLIEASV